MSTEAVIGLPVTYSDGLNTDIQENQVFFLFWFIDLV